MGENNIQDFRIYFHFDVASLRGAFHGFTLPGNKKLKDIYIRLLSQRVSSFAVWTVSHKTSVVRVNKPEWTVVQSQPKDAHVVSVK